MAPTGNAKNPYLLVEGYEKFATELRGDEKTSHEGD